MFCVLGYTLVQEGNIEKVNFQYTPFKNNVLYLYYDERRDLRWNIEHKGNPEGEARGISWGLRLYFTVYPDLSHNTDILNF